jgi:diguanylate cyclase (GGDEF)-like protein/PAS domain S-box-containing protein
MHGARLYAWIKGGKMNLSAELIAAICTATNDGILVASYGADLYPIIYCNPTFTRLTGYSQEDLLGQELLFPPLAQLEPHAWQTVAQALRDGAECNFKLRTRTKDGRTFWNQLRICYVTGPQGITHAIALHTDISQQEYVKNVLDKVSLLYREMSKRLEFTNETDHLTQLKNRCHLSTRGEFMLGAAKREKLRMHALRIELEGFKLLATMGSNDFGDQCLVRVADIIKRHFLRATDIAIRMDDGEFVVLCIEDDDNQVWARAEQLREEIRALQLQDTVGRVHAISVNIGIYSTLPSKHTTIEEMIQNAAQLVFQLREGRHDATGQSPLMPH